MAVDASSRRFQLVALAFVAMLGSAMFAACTGDGDREVDVELTASAVARADRAAEIQSKTLDERNREQLVEWDVLGELVDDAGSEGRRLDAEAVADAWLEQADGVEPVTRFVDAVSEDPDIEMATADRYVMAVSLASALSDAARDELVALFEGSVSVDEFETWLNTDSSGAIIVKYGLRTVGE